MVTKQPTGYKKTYEWGILQVYSLRVANYNVPVFDLSLVLSASGIQLPAYSAK